jgi:hypothetical protein
MTLRVAYIGIEPLFNLWNYFFRGQLWLGSDTEAAAWGSVNILV